MINPNFVERVEAFNSRGDDHDVTTLFKQKYDNLIKHFWSRDPNFWPAFATPEFQKILKFLIERKYTETEASEWTDGEALKKEFMSTTLIPDKSVDDPSYVLKTLDFLCATSKNYYHSSSAENVIALPSDPALYGSMMCLLVNPNIVHVEYSKMAAEVEDRVVTQLGNQVGWDGNDCTGIFTSGGTLCNVYGYLLGIRKAFRNSVHEGIMADIDYRFFHSEFGHYSNVTALSTLGINIRDRTVKLKALDDNSLDPDHLEQCLDQCFNLKIKVPAILVTVGTTDTFSVDNVKKVYQIREKLVKKWNLIEKGEDWIPHIHADAAVGWSMIFIKDYDCEKNVLGVNPHTLQVIKQHQANFQDLKYADSITCDFHKWGYTPYSSSVVLIKKKKDLDFLQNDPENFSYFNSNPEGHTQYHATIECSRGCVGIFGAWTHINSLGLEGLQIIIAHCLQNANYLRDQLHKHIPRAHTVCDDAGGPSVVFRIYPHKENTIEKTAQCFKEETLGFKAGDKEFAQRLERVSKYHRQCFDELKGGLSTNWIQHMTRTNYDEQGKHLYIPGQKAVFFNPHTTYRQIDEFVELLKSVTEKHIQHYSDKDD